MCVSGALLNRGLQSDSKPKHLTTLSNKNTDGPTNSWMSQARFGVCFSDLTRVQVHSHASSFMRLSLGTAGL